MTAMKLDEPDPPACPALGLADDRRSHFTYPHPGHRCFAKGDAAKADPRRQATFCLSPEFASCDRFRAWHGLATSAGEPETRPPAAPVQARPTTTTPAGASPGTTVVYVFRAGDSLARIATKYGLTVEDLMIANRIPFGAQIPDGTRLLIPLGLPGERPQSRR